MAKFIKSFFHPSERKKAQHHEDQEEDKTENPTVCPKRQLSISRSGRMRQNTKKRHSLALGVYGDSIQLGSSEKPTSVEYHVNSQISHTAPAIMDGTDDSRLQYFYTNYNGEKSVDIATDVNLEKKIATMDIDDVRSPEEEIDSAFEIIDKS